MNDPNLLLKILREMAADNEGRLICVLTSGSSSADRRIRHHIEQLVDVGYSAWISDRREIVRITSAGYDFLRAVDANAEAKKRFFDGMSKGLPFAHAAMKTVELVKEMFK